MQVQRQLDSNMSSLPVLSVPSAYSMAGHSASHPSLQDARLSTKVLLVSALEGGNQEQETSLARDRVG